MPADPDQKPSSHRRPKPLRPKIVGFDEMFVNHQPDDDGEENDQSGIGLPFGSTLLLSGPPGAGKTTFALSMVRSLMVQAEPDRLGVTPADSPLTSPIVYFISSEINLSRLRKMYHPLGWFAEEDDDRKGLARPSSFSKLFRFGENRPDRDNLYVIVPEPAVDRPVPTPEELVNDVFNRIAKSLSPSESDVEDCDVIVVVDSITAILKGCAANDERRHAHEILHRLRSMFGRQHLALTILLAEQDHPDRIIGQSSTVEDYLADIVFRLSHKALPLGRRNRVLEVVKSQGVNIIAGEHSWAIITQRTCTDWLRHPRYVELVKTWACSQTDIDEKVERWGTVAIFTRPRLLLRNHQGQPSGTRAAAGQAKAVPQPQDDWKDPKNFLRTGTDGLDEMLESEPVYWLGSSGSAPRRADECKPSLPPGSTTLMAGPMGSGKTSICMQFLLQDAREFKVNPGDYTLRRAKGPQTGTDAKKEKRRNLFVCLGPDANKTVEEAWEATFAGGTGPFTSDEWVAVLDFTQSHFDFNHLMAHLKWALGEFLPLRIAFDGLSEWLTMFERADAAKMLEAIGVVIDHHTDFKKNDLPRPTVFMAYELSSGTEPFTVQSVTVAAENIVTIRQVNIQDEIRRIVFVLKSTGVPDRNVRELSLRSRKRLQVLDTLDTFNGLLRGHPEPAEVLLKLFRENYPQRCFNQWLVHQLSKLSNLRFKTLDFSRSEIGRTLEDTASQIRFPPADLKIISVDEWWLRAQLSCKDQPVLDLKPMWSLGPVDPAPIADDAERAVPALSIYWQDFWLAELQKASVDGGNGGIYAVPGYSDYGLFCVNLKMLFGGQDEPVAPLSKPANALGKDQEEILRAHYRSVDPSEGGSTQEIDGLKDAVTAAWKDLVRGMPRYWVGMEGEEFDLNPSAGPDTVFGWLRGAEAGRLLAADGREKRWGFSFDMATRETCVCVFFELAWAFGAREDFLAGDAEAEQATSSCLRAIRFLQLLVLTGLMPSRGTVETTRHSLFSHHFYSTLQSVADLERWDRHGGKDEEVSKEERRAAWRHSGPTPAPKLPPYAPPTLVAIPLFPAGARAAGQSARAAAGHLLADIEQRLLELCELFQRSRFAGPDERGEITKAGKRSWAGRIKVYREITGRLLDRLRKKFDPGDVDSTRTERLSPTFDDLLEMGERLAMCLRLCSAGGRSLAEIIQPSAPMDLPSEPEGQAGAFYPSGYSCAGSWLYGIDKHTRSPSLARNLLQEITSLDAAEERARRGAGIPARRDFFDLHGHEPVPGMEYLSWRGLLRSCGGRSRQRSSVLGTLGRATVLVHQVIQDELLRCLQVAHLHAPAEARDNPGLGKPYPVGSLRARLKDTEFAAQEMIAKIKQTLRAVRPSK